MNQLKKHLHRQKGFTLIELLVVVAIIAILALIVLLALNPVEMARKSRDSRRLSDMGTLRKAIDLSLSDGETLVDTAGAWVNIDSTTSVTQFPNGALGDTNIGKYLSAAPGDPYSSTSLPQVLGVAAGVCSGSTGALADLQYQFISDGDVYVLRARLESEDSCPAITSDGNAASNFYELGTDPGLDM